MLAVECDKWGDIETADDFWEFKLEATVFEAAAIAGAADDAGDFSEPLPKSDAKVTTTGPLPASDDAAIATGCAVAGRELLN